MTEKNSRRNIKDFSMKFLHVLRIILQWFLCILPFFLLFFFLFLLIARGVLKQSIQSEKVLASPMQLSQTVSYPVLTLSSVPISAKSAVVFDVDNKVIVFSKNP